MGQGGNRPVDVDGDLVTHTPAIFRVLPGAIEVIVPAESSSDDGRSASKT
jgi:diacylglycerol kinase family enzyme